MRHTRHGRMSGKWKIGHRNFGIGQGRKIELLPLLGVPIRAICPAPPRTTWKISTVLPWLFLCRPGIFNMAELAFYFRLKMLGAFVLWNNPQHFFEQHDAFFIRSRRPELLFNFLILRCQIRRHKLKPSTINIIPYSAHKKGRV